MRPSSSDKCQRGREPVIREDGSIEIPLTQGQVAIVSPESYPLVAVCLWYAAWSPHPRTYYARSWVGSRRVDMQVFLFCARADHINHDTLDNRTSNLRPATCLQNMRNRRKITVGTSAYKGVYRHKKSWRWCARITIGRRARTLGSFDDEVSAARAYDAAARQHFGEFAFTNEDAGLLPAMKETGT